MHLRFLSCVFLTALPALSAPTLEGTVSPFRKVELSAAVSSHIVELSAGEGDLVKAGQPLAQLYVRLEELEMRRTKALLERREYEAKGAKNLFDSRVIPETKALESRFELELARLHFETASEQVRLRTLLSPIDGMVIERTREVGEAVSPAQPIFRIVDLSKAFILCAARPDKVARLLPGQKLTVRLPHLEAAAPFQAEVVVVGPCSEATGLCRLKLLVRNPVAGIRAGMKAVVELPENP